MRWDTVERELVVLARDFTAAAKTLTALAGELQRERSRGSLRLTKGDGPAVEIVPIDETGPEAQSSLFD